MVFDIDIHESILGPFKDLKFLDENSFKKCVFFAFLNNKYIYLFLFLFLKKKFTTVSKMMKLYNVN
jgi:hypothetical protein